MAGSNKFYNICNSDDKINDPPWKKELIERRRAAAGRSLTCDTGRRKVNANLSVSCPTPGSSGSPHRQDPTLPQSISERRPCSAFPRAYSSECTDFNPECSVRNMRLFDLDLSSDFIINSYKYEANSDSSMKRMTVGEKSLKKPPFKTMERHKDLRTVNDVKKNSKDDEYQSDSSEELQYGPGIVNKLKTKYLSLTLRETQKLRVRPSLSNLRRATSLENILDEENDISQPKSQSYTKKPVQSAVNKNSKVSQYCAKYLNSNKGNDLMKRAQSMDALYRNEPKNVTLMTKSVTMESRMSNGNDIVIIDNLEKDDLYSKPLKEEVSKELPPPDVVKQTLKIFEKTANNVSKPEVCVVPKVRCLRNQPKSNPIEKKKLSAKPVVLPKPILSNDKLSVKTKVIALKRESIVSSTPPRNPPKIPSKVDFYNRLVSPPPVSPIEDTPDAPKMVSRRALENIGKEGSTVKFSFCDSLVTPAHKPYLPKQGLTQATNSTLISQSVVAPTSQATKVTPSQRLSPNRLTSPPPSERPPTSPKPIDVSPTKQIAVIRPVVTNKIQPPTLTNVEIEKNLINKVKSNEVKPNGDNCDGSSEKVSLWDSKAWHNQNTMVFNFSNRKDIPDYIENDGLILSEKKDRLNCNGDGSLCHDSEDEGISEPGSPCLAVNIVGGNVLINGKSNLRKEPKQHKLRIQFNDAATTLFEYPREEPITDEPPTPSPTSPIISSGSLSTYTPAKTVDKFELGVSRLVHHQPSPPPPPPPPADYLKPVESDSVTPWSQETTSDILF